jgi:hypothetical protein
MKLIDEVLVGHPDHLRARYCKGILLLNDSHPAEALEQFRAVAAADPGDAYAHYYVGQCLAVQGKHADALDAYARAAAIDPHLRSAWYGMFQAKQKLGDPAGAKAALAEFQGLKDNPQARLVEFKYTRMGPKAQVVVSPARASTTAPAPPAGPVFADAVPLPISNGASFDWSRLPEDATLTAADIDGDGQVDLFIAGGGLRGKGGTNVVLLRRGDHFEMQGDPPLAKVAGVHAAVWGDFDNDGLADVYLCRRGANQLWRQTKPNQWTDVTASAEAAGNGADTVTAACFDADHDGDLDLFLVNLSGKNELLNNNGDGTFRAIGEQAGVCGNGNPSAGVVVTDLDHDGDADIFVVKVGTPNEIWLNDRAWKYHLAAGAEYDNLVRSPMAGLCAADTDADGQVELYSVSMLGLVRSARGNDGVWRFQRPRRDQNDVFRIADCDGTGRLKPVTAPAFANWELVELDPGLGPSIVGLVPGKPPMIRRPGPGRFPFATITLTGRNSAADQMRSNASGIGVKIAARVGDRWTVTDTYPSHYGFGQSLQPISIGLGGAPAADFVRLTWPDGLRQTELAVPAGKLTRIEETQRQTSSCPVIFAWDGTRYAFVTDCLGVGGIGFAAGAPGEYVLPRPWENVLLPAGLARARDGRLRIKIDEPMEEACYLDRARLVAYDLPPGWRMALDERMATGAPDPTGEPRFYRRLRVPTRATNDRGQDVTAALARVADVAAPVPAVERRFIGFTRGEHVLTMEFDAPIAGAGGTGDVAPTLLIDGWIEYPYSQTMFAAWQARAAYRPPTLEARGADGRWVEVLHEFGYPAGMPREMSVPIPVGKLPAGTAALRLRTTQEIYFDRIAVAYAEPCPQAKRIVLPLASSRLAEVGFAARANGPQRRPRYDYDRRAPLQDQRHQDGFYTTFGAVDELVGRADGALAIFGPGEEVHLEFAALRDPPPGWSRRLVLELAGWCKDADLYTKDGQTLDPLPAPQGASADEVRRRDALNARFNTRYRSGG